MKCAVVVVLCGLAASFAEPTLRTRHGRQHDGNYHKQEETSYETVYDRGYSDYRDYSVSSTASPVKYDNEYQNQIQLSPNERETYQNVGYVEQPNVVDINSNLHYEPQKYQDNNYVQYAPVPHGPVSHYYPGGSVGAPFPSHSTPTEYGPPLAPYPVQYNQYQIGDQHAPAQPNYNGYNDLFGAVFAPAPTSPAKPATTKATTTQAPPPPQPPNNILSLLLSLSQGSSSLSLPKTTRRPAATAAPMPSPSPQPAPKAQVYSFANVPPPFQSHQDYYPQQRRVFTPFFG